MRHLTAEEIAALSKGIPVKHVEDKDTVMDKDDVLSAEYPGVSKFDKKADDEKK